MAELNLGPKWRGVRCSFKASWFDAAGRCYCGQHAIKHGERPLEAIYEITQPKALPGAD
jgi:hypothetical protein